MADHLDVLSRSSFIGCSPPCSPSSSPPHLLSPSSSTISSPPPPASPASADTATIPSLLGFLSSTATALPSTPPSSPPRSLRLCLPPRSIHVDFNAFGYQHICVLSSGQGGVAHLVRCLSQGELWVAKVIRLLGPREASRALDEAARLRQLAQSEFIVGYRESFVKNDSLVIVMQYCEKGDLFGLIIQKQQSKSFFQEKQILMWMKQILLGLQFMHAENILHCDIKSTNIFITAQNSVKIGDLGVARILNKVESLTTPCSSTPPRGTPMYMSPEMSRGETLSSRTDCWSVGCVLYEMCCLSHAVHRHAAHTTKCNNDNCNNGNNGNCNNGNNDNCNNGNNDNCNNGNNDDDSGEGNKKSLLPTHYSSYLSTTVESLLQKDPMARPSVDELLNSLCNHLSPAAAATEATAAGVCTPTTTTAGVCTPTTAGVCTPTTADVCTTTTTTTAGVAASACQTKRRSGFM
eukprot:GHVS01094654.1.p1 GENE.GHVS01094654.1~~GHVS01094654.1.p1  ORF type:complete len:495 (-),score=125.84 GHVS01094654.1:287-1675(-)